MAKNELIRFSPMKVMPDPQRILARSGCPPLKGEGFLGDMERISGILAELARPAAVYRTMRITGRSDSEIVTEDMVLRSLNLIRHLGESGMLTVFLVTLGKGPEMEVSRLQSLGMFRDSLFLDSAASCMVDNTARRLHALLASEYHDMTGTSRFSPGFGDLGLSSQKTIFSLLEGKRVGVRLRSDSMTLEPLKSGTGVMGWISRKS